MNKERRLMFIKLRYGWNYSCDECKNSASADSKRNSNKTYKELCKYGHFALVDTRNSLEPFKKLRVHRMREEYKAIYDKSGTRKKVVTRQTREEDDVIAENAMFCEHFEEKDK